MGSVLRLIRDLRVAFSRVKMKVGEMAQYSNSRIRNPLPVRGVQF